MKMEQCKRGPRQDPSDIQVAWGAGLVVSAAESSAATGITASEIAYASATTVSEGSSTTSIQLA
jgi:hypothetical protein